MSRSPLTRKPIFLPEGLYRILSRVTSRGMQALLYKLERPHSATSLVLARSLNLSAFCKLLCKLSGPNIIPKPAWIKHLYIWPLGIWSSDNSPPQKASPFYEGVCSISRIFKIYVYMSLN